MKRKTFKKYLHFANKMYDLEVEVSIGEPTNRERQKHKKMRKFYDKSIMFNPVYLNLLYKEVDS